MKIKKVAVVGAGTMGHGIAQLAATAGFEVKITDAIKQGLEEACNKITVSLERLVQKGKMAAEEKKAVINRLQFVESLDKTVMDADIIIEAVFENLDIKKQLFKDFDRLTKPQSILASNTSQYSITEIASVISDPSRVVGMHFFNPPVVMKLIEAVRGLETSEKVIEEVKEFGIKLGKEVVVCRDSQGFISTRVLVALRLECYRLLEEGVATKEDIDKTLKLAFGHPMGQFELADFSGLDIEVPICEGLAKVFGDRFRPPQTLVHLVKAGRIGRKAGKGWYNYTDK